MTPVFSLTAVAGATGGVGRLLVQGLCDSGVPVRALVRDKCRAKLPEAVSVTEVESFWSDESIDSLCAGLEGCECLFICISSTAFPTRAWFERGDTPHAVDVKGVGNILKCVDRAALKRIVYVSSIGTSFARRKALFSPFSILNMFGVLDAKAEAEELVKRYARGSGCGFSVVRLGRLIGGRHSNSSEIKKGIDGRIGDAKLLAGDTGFGDCSRQLAADVLLITGQTPFNLDFSVFEMEGYTTSRAELRWKVEAMRTND